MNAPIRLALFGVGLVVLFGGAFVAGGVVVPDSVVASWADRSDEGSSSHTPSAMEGHDMATAVDELRGTSLSAGDLLLGPVSAPTSVGTEGVLTFRVETAGGDPVTEFETEHDKKLHLIVVRSDGTQFRHVHPTMASDGTWTIPWEWDAAGTYRVYADFVPSSSHEATTLTRTVDVAGDLVLAPPTGVSSQDTVDGLTVTLNGDLTAGSSATITATVTRNGESVTALEPYLGAYGHLVALRDGDLAYLHVHPDGQSPTRGETSGPDIAFMADVPTPGRYLLYLDFQVDGTVHTAHFVVDAGRASGDDASDMSDGSDHDGH